MATYVFDLDETLLHTSERRLHAHAHPIVLDGKELFVHVRPGAQALLRQLLRLQDARVLRLGVWTAATKAYAGKVLAKLLGSARNVARLSFVYTRRDCDALRTADGQPRYVKPLAKFFRPSRRVQLFDDNEDNIALNRAMGFSVVHVPPFFGERADAQLHTIHAAVVETVGRALGGDRPA